MFINNLTDCSRTNDEEKRSLLDPCERFTDRAAELREIFTVSVRNSRGKVARQRHRKLGELAIADHPRERVGKSELADAEFEGHFPARRRADQDCVSRRDRPSNRERQFGAVAPPPQHDVCVEQQLHRLRFSTASPLASNASSISSG